MVNSEMDVGKVLALYNEMNIKTDQEIITIITRDDLW
jgi:hypothetical protein